MVVKFTDNKGNEEFFKNLKKCCLKKKINYRYIRKQVKLREGTYTTKEYQIKRIIIQ